MAHADDDPGSFASISPSQPNAHGPSLPSDMDIWRGAGGWMNKADTQAARDRLRDQKKE